VIGDTPHVAVRTARSDDHVVTEAGFLVDVDGDDVFGLGVFETGKDGFEGAGGCVKTADPGRRRRDVGLLREVLFSVFFPFRSRTTKSPMR
jgi:hypothetical protein